MTPEEKAEQLIKSFDKHLWTDQGDEDIARDCAIECVEQIRLTNPANSQFWWSVLFHLKTM